jgi:hypothetical protein
MLSDVAGFAITDAHRLDDHIQGLLRGITVSRAGPL